MVVHQWDRLEKVETFATPNQDSVFSLATALHQFGLHVSQFAPNAGFLAELAHNFDFVWGGDGEVFEFGTNTLFGTPTKSKIQDVDPPGGITNARRRRWKQVRVNIGEVYQTHSKTAYSGFPNCHNS